MKLGRYARDGEIFVGAVNERGDIIKLGYGGDTIAALKDHANLTTAVAQAAIVIPSSECTVTSAAHCRAGVWRCCRYSPRLLDARRSCASVMSRDWRGAD